jgi:hypothetical protein
LILGGLADYAFAEMGFQKPGTSRKILLLLDLCRPSMNLRFSYR